MADPSLTYDGRVVLSGDELDRLEAIKVAARAVVERWRWDLANQPEIAALAEALK